jgi:hypothetical protein
MRKIWNDEAEAAIALLLTPAKLEEFKTFVLAGPPPPLNRGRKVEEGGLPPASIPSFLTDVSPTIVSHHLDSDPLRRSSSRKKGAQLSTSVFDNPSLASSTAR